MARTVTVQPGQCLEDIALQEYGSLNGVRELLLDNEALLADGFSTDLEAGMALLVRDTPSSPEVYMAMRKLGVVPATSIDDDGPTLGPGGDHNNDFNDDHNIT